MEYVVQSRRQQGQAYGKDQGEDKREHRTAERIGYRLEVGGVVEGVLSLALAVGFAWSLHAIWSRPNKTHIGDTVSRATCHINGDRC